MYNFDEICDRKNTDSLKWDVKKNELPMWVADMDFKTAPEVVKAIENRAHQGIYGYTIVPDRWYNAIIDWWKTRHNFEIKKEWLQFSTGVVPAISSIVKRVTNIGDRVALLTPVYDIFFHSVENAGRTVYECPLSYSNGKYCIDFELLEKVLSHPLTTMLIFCNPHNPTGNVWKKEELERVGALCKKHGVVVLSDEIHCDLKPNCPQYIPFPTASCECKEVSITCVSASKAFNLAGLQSAAVIVPNKNLREKVVRGLNSDEVAEPNCFAIEGTVAAFTQGGKWLEELNQYLSENRKVAEDMIEKKLKDKLTIVKGGATYLMWIDCSVVIDDSEKFCEYLRKNFSLYISSGTQYRGNGKQFVRINLACPRSQLICGVQRFIDGVLSL
jgi:cystathionine beta-lyase